MMDTSDPIEHIRYGLLKIESELSENGICLALYRDERIKEAASAKLPNISHLCPTEDIPETIVRHRSQSPTIFWISPDAEKDLFSCFPDFYHAMIGVYDFSGVSGEIRQSRKGALISEDLPAAAAENVSKYLEKMLEQYEQSQPYHIPSYFTNRKGKTFLLDDLVRAFLSNTGNTDILLLSGEANTGKTSFLRNCFANLSKKFLKSPDNERIPVFVTLSGYGDSPDVETFVFRKFLEICQTDISSDIFLESCRKGKFVFLLDGFDEMTTGMEFERVRDILKNIFRFSFEEGAEKPTANKVMMTCVPHYFFNDIRDGKPLRPDDHTPLYREYGPKRNVEAVCINPKVFDDAQIKEYVFKTIKDGIAARNMLHVLQDDQLGQISDPAILAKMVIETAPLFGNKKEINAADVYRAYTDIWIERQDFRFRLNPREKREILWELARSKSSAKAEDTRFCPFLRSDDKGKPAFVHPSFSRYFLAQQYFDRIRNKQERLFPASDTDPETAFFLKQIISSEKADLKGLDLSAMDLEKVNLYRADLSGADLSKANLKSAELMNAVLRGTDLTGANMAKARLTRADFNDADLSGADLSKARLRDAELGTAKLNGANFGGADLTGAKLAGAKLTFAGLSEADLTHADLSGAMLCDADLSNAKLCQSNLCKADLTCVNLSGADLTDADMVEALLTDADLRKAKMVMANLTWAKLGGADLSEADMTRSRLREADMTDADFHQSTMNQADLRWAKIDRARFREAKLREAHFTGASLVGVLFAGADLGWVNFNGAILKDADLSDAKLNMSKLSEADLSGSRLVGTDLTWADLTKANLRKADLSSANLSEADLRDADFGEAKLVKANLVGANLKNAKFDGADITGAVFDDTKK